MFIGEAGTVQSRLIGRVKRLSQTNAKGCLLVATLYLVRILVPNTCVKYLSICNIFLKKRIFFLFVAGASQPS